ncbi:hypothetical protein [Desulfosudis oleivorans]|uniref:DUF4402 domain-containing protein n=1 Tax=Desulfosudis oleivorans (strain DSM 6200 / JCM 39069 / Hxd3) TaxID=96561 RepID=A8ZVN7_DESOH|nr:hypothetical protein [Desulfosudis oleivorans]ABW68224.1 hypothetical protein Dole_2420 [Desulfosudis oleivorans Hxd3]
MKKLLIALVAGMLMIVPAMAMDTISDADLDGISGQAGVRVVFGGTSGQTISFTSLAWGDTDGFNAADGAGYLRVQSAAGESINITVEIPDGAKLTLDVAHLAAAEVINGTTIASGEDVVKVGLPDQNVTVDMPSMLVIGLGDSAAAIDGTLGTLTLENLSIGVTQASALYIYAD